MPATQSSSPTWLSVPQVFGPPLIVSQGDIRRDVELSRARTQTHTSQYGIKVSQETTAMSKADPICGIFISISLGGTIVFLASTLWWSLPMEQRTDHNFLSTVWQAGIQAQEKYISATSMSVIRNQIAPESSHDIYQSQHLTRSLIRNLETENSTKPSQDLTQTRQDIIKCWWF